MIFFDCFWAGLKVRILRLRYQNLKQAIFFGRYDMVSCYPFQKIFQAQKISLKNS